MADQLYYSVFTKKGLELLTEAIRNGTKLGITSMAFGDGNGELPTPDDSFTKLVNEVYRTQLNSLAPDPNNANWLRAEAVIASATGGFNIRELGLYAGNVLVAYSNYPATYKPNPSDGTARIMTFRMILQIDNVANFELVIDPDIVLATIQSVNDAKAEIYNNSIMRVESIEDLSQIDAYEGQIIYVKSYYAGLNKGGGTRIYVASRKTENDGFLCINGWILQLENNIFNPYMSGCVCDGMTDDTLNLDKLMYALEKNDIAGKVTIDDDMFFNSQCPLVGKLQYSMNFGDGLPVIRLVDNVDIEIKSTLKFGSFYNDKAIAVFNAKYNSDANDWLGNKHYNINIYGGGTLDFSQAGNMQTAYRSRICFSLANCTNSSVHNLTVIKGDFMNTVVTNYRGNGVDIHGMIFIDQMADDSKSHDHSTMYLIAENCRVYDNQFISSGIKTRLNACCVEFHGNNQHMYGNKVMLGYRNAVFIAAYILGHEGVNDTYRGDITIQNNTASCLSFFKLWTDSRLPIGKIECQFNTQNHVVPVTQDEALSVGFTAQEFSNLPQVAHFFGTETDQNAKSFPDSINAHVKIWNNNFNYGFNDYNREFFFYMPLILKDGLDIQFNNIKSRQLFSLSDWNNYGQEMTLRKFIFKNNDVSWGDIYDKLAISTAEITLIDSEISLRVTSSFSEVTNLPYLFYIDLNTDNSYNNRFSFTSEKHSIFSILVGGSLPKKPRHFYSYNKLIYDAKIKISQYESSNKTVILFSTDTNLSEGVQSVSAYEHQTLDNLPTNLVLPAIYLKDIRKDASQNQICALSTYVDNNPSVEIYAYCQIKC